MEDPQVVLSIYWNGPKHLILAHDDKGQFRLEGQSFTSVPDLIDHYHTTGNPIIQQNGAQLLRPKLRNKWQLDNNDLVQDKLLGTGHFGEVWKGHLLTEGGQIEVAIKTCKNTISMEEKNKFIAEARIMRQYSHPNIVRFIGVAAQKDPMMLVMELVSDGSLKEHLRKEKSNISLREKQRFCYDAVKGMEYLENKRCIHRDLAARNCLLDDTKTVKISDFGMSQVDIEYQAVKGKPVPVRWTAPEAILKRIYTSKSDVWSYGVLVWEIYNNGDKPYADKINKEVVPFIKNGDRLEASSDMPDYMVTLMFECWEENPQDRPTFFRLRRDLQKHVKIRR